MKNLLTSLAALLLAEQGLPGYEFTNWFAVVAPGRTPPALVERIHAGELDLTLVSEGHEPSSIGTTKS